MAQSSNLFSLARSKLNLSVESKDSFSLHRWVLLKNSIIQSLPLVASSSSSSCPAATAGSLDLEDEADDEADSFMFPQLVNAPSPAVNASEAAWLDSLLETLGEDDDDDFNPDSDVHVSVVPVDDDEDLAPSPPISPMSSSDDLTTQSYYPYLVPYPPFSPPLISPYHFNPHASSPPYVDPLPYCDLDDMDDFPPVPDAIEDTSDDESEAPPTPGQSLSSLDPASIPLPAEHSRLRHSTPQIYIEQDDEYFYPIDPLPFPDNHHSPLTYPEC